MGKRCNGMSHSYYNYNMCVVKVAGLPVGVSGNEYHLGLASL